MDVSAQRIHRTGLIRGISCYTTDDMAVQVSNNVKKPHNTIEPTRVMGAARLSYTSECDARRPVVVPLSPHLVDTSRIRIIPRV